MAGGKRTANVRAAMQNQRISYFKTTTTNTSKLEIENFNGAASTHIQTKLNMNEWPK